VSKAATNGEGGSAPVKSKARINLERSAILLVDNALGVDILSHIFMGFGARTLYRSNTAAQAMEIVAGYQLDLIVTEALLQDRDGYDLIKTVRSDPEYEHNRFVPAIILSAHTAVSKVNKARDCGANFFVAKPVSPRVIMDRILWVAREQRQFLQTDLYAGPDRRFHDLGAPPGIVGRRREDRAAPIELKDDDQ
jgi:CheY-like chemotaxis protein